MSVGVNQVAQIMRTVISNPITSQVQHFEMLTDWYAFDQWVNHLLLFHLIVLQVEFLEPALWMTNKLHHLVVELWDHVKWHVQCVYFEVQVIC